MELPKRKPLRLQSYEYSQNGAYFITICTQDRRNLFDINVGADPCVCPNHANELVAKWLIKLEEKYQNVKIDKFVIMPNHIHFILMIDHPAGVHVGHHFASKITCGDCHIFGSERYAPTRNDAVVQNPNDK